MMMTTTMNATTALVKATTTLTTTRSAKGKRSTSLTTVRSAQKEEGTNNAGVVATGVAAATVLMSGGEARASELTETVASGVNQGVEIAYQAKEAYDEAVPVVTPYAE